MGQTVFVTGAGGFIGGVVARILRERGDVVVAVVRDPARSASLADLGVRVIAGDLDTSETVRGSMGGCDAVIHVAGMYEVGIPASRHAAMYAANVTLTERILDAAIAEGVPRTIYVSTVNVFGDTARRVVDETYRRDLADGFLSYYDETKYLAHQAAETRIAAGAPVTIVQPGVTYGPNDHIATGATLQAAYDGKLRYIALPGLGVCPTHVDDIAAGIVAALDRGRIGQSYILAGDSMMWPEAQRIAARAGGHRPPRLTIPDAPLRLAARIVPNGGRLVGLDPNLREIMTASVGVTYWGSHDKATAELGFSPRDLASGARDAFGPPR